MTAEKNRMSLILAAVVLLGLAGMAGCGAAPQTTPQKAETPDIQSAEAKDPEERTDISATGAVGEGADVSTIDVAKEGTDASVSEMPEEEDVSAEDALEKDDFGISHEGEETTVELSFAMAKDYSGLSEEVLNQIEALNRGEPPREALGMEALEGYYALVGTSTVIGKDKESGAEVPGRGRLTIYVPNLLSGLADVSVLFYDNGAGYWRILAVEKADVKAKTLSVILPGSGTLTVIYKKRG